MRPFSLILGAGLLWTAPAARAAPAHARNGHAAGRDQAGAISLSRRHNRRLCKCEHSGHPMAMTGALGPYPMTREIVGHGVAAGYVRHMPGFTS